MIQWNKLFGPQGSSSQCRIEFHKLGAISHCIKLFTPQASPSLVRTCVYAITNLMRGNVDYFTVEETLPYLSRLIYAADTSTRIYQRHWNINSQRELQTFQFVIPCLKTLTAIADAEIINPNVGNEEIGESANIADILLIRNHQDKQQSTSSIHKNDHSDFIEEERNQTKHELPSYVLLDKILKLHLRLDETEDTNYLFVEDDWNTSTIQTILYEECSLLEALASGARHSVKKIIGCGVIPLLVHLILGHILSTARLSTVAVSVAKTITTEALMAIQIMNEKSQSLLNFYPLKQALKSAIPCNPAQAIITSAAAHAYSHALELGVDYNIRAKACHVLCNILYGSVRLAQRLLLGNIPNPSDLLIKKEDQNPQENLRYSIQLRTWMDKSGIQQFIEKVQLHKSSILHRKALVLGKILHF
ncbi:MAG: hypothetical protein EZS28_021673 [Streblomastix strix]|uniref:Uncharacterized protein n=1 Tax=Streblomastix strix TaxID=222440 RepID=A0A5J4VJQ4_9EUKA|nr:MAG: hypothetical protein EZS28_021673 [Streblomastix strix]